MTKQFTAENLARLEALYGKLSFSGATLEGKLGANTLNPFELLNDIALNTLRERLSYCKQTAQKTSELDEWSLTEYQLEKQRKYETWAEFLNLLIGYKLDQAEKANKAEAARKLREKLKDLREEAKTPAERLAALEAELADLEA